MCDTHARAFVKYVKGHGGYFACERCYIKGERFRNRTTYPTTNNEKRTDETFTAFLNEKHHTGISPLLDINPKINMIGQFILDYMHLGYLGIIKKLIDYWSNSLSLVNFDNVLIFKLSQCLLNISNQIKNDFRTTRYLADFYK